VQLSGNFSRIFSGFFSSVCAQLAQSFAQLAQFAQVARNFIAFSVQFSRKVCANFAFFPLQFSSGLFPVFQD